MTTAKKAALAFMAAMNVINIISGIITQLDIALGKNVKSILPVSASLTSAQVLLVNFLAVTVIILLISIVTTYLATDIAYSPIEIIQNSSLIFLLIPAALLIFGIVNGVRAELSADRLWIIFSSIFHFAASAVNLACTFTVYQDAAE